MSEVSATSGAREPIGLRGRAVLSHACVWLALALLAATYFLISPAAEQTYPGAVPWREGSLLKSITDVMSLGGAFRTERGVEIKDVAFYAAAALGLVLLAARAFISAWQPIAPAGARGPWFVAQLFLAGWVALSLFSARWSGDPATALGQGLLYALAVSWAVALAWTLESWAVARLLSGYVVIAAVGAVLCIWYFIERNPGHRPGFPIGNPSVLAACMLPAFLLCACRITGVLVDRGRLTRAGVLSLAGNVVALGALAGCLFVTQSRGGLAGLAAGVGLVLLLRLKRRARWAAFVVMVLVIAAASVWLYAARLDPSMARGASLRFRFYAWQYAATLWWQRPITGMGAAAYPRLAGEVAIWDRQLDPAAFMGDIVEHAHNELFEVLVEIGLVGGVTFVGAYIATLIGALGLLQTNLSSRRRWMVIGMLAGFVAMIVDGLFGVGLRLPGLPAVFYTLLGAMWAACRYAFRGPQASAATPAVAQMRRKVLRRVVVGCAALAGACGAGWLTWRNASAALDAHAADVALRSGDVVNALRLTRQAEPRLLDPVRALAAGERAVRCQFALARAAFRDARRSGTAAANPFTLGPTSDPSRSTAPALAEQAFVAAADFQRRAPTFGRMASIGGRCAEMLADLHTPSDAKAAETWRLRAEQAWRVERLIRPYDPEVLLALMPYVVSIQDRAVMLRDALRDGFPGREWYEALAALRTLDGFETAVADLQAGVGPINPQTDVDTILLSMAPESLRLGAALEGAGGSFAAAAPLAARAAELYLPLRPRFPELYSVALAEAAEYAFRSDPRNPAEPLRLIELALAALPAIQQQKLEELQRPFQVRAAGYLLAARRESDAAGMLAGLVDNADRVPAALADAYVNLAQSFIPVAAADRPAISEWLVAACRLQPAHAQAWAWRAWLAGERGDGEAVRAMLHAAAAAGVSEAELASIRRGLAQEYPALAPQLESQ